MVDDHEAVQLAVDAINKSPSIKLETNGEDNNSLHSVIQTNNQQSVIQTAQVITKGNVILVSKPSSVIQTTQGNISTLQVVDASNSDDNYSEDDQPKKSHEQLTRRASYRKIFDDLGGSGGEIAVVKGYVTSNGSPIMLKEAKIEYSSECDTTFDSEMSCNSPKYTTVIPASAIQIQGDTVHGIVTNSPGSGTLLQYATHQNTEGQYFVPVCSGDTVPKHNEEQARKREMRLLKNREAARECRRKKKEYIKCLENRVAVLENQNKTLIDELKSLKELYCCETKND